MKRIPVRHVLNILRSDLAFFRDSSSMSAEDHARLAEAVAHIGVRILESAHTTITSDLRALALAYVKGESDALPDNV